MRLAPLGDLVGVGARLGAEDSHTERLEFLHKAHIDEAFRIAAIAGRALGSR